jgi:hypothetical protein
MELSQLLGLAIYNAQEMMELKPDSALVLAQD